MPPTSQHRTSHHDVHAQVRGDRCSRSSAVLFLPEVSLARAGKQIVLNLAFFGGCFSILEKSYFIFSHWHHVGKQIRLNLAVFFFFFFLENSYFSHWHHVSKL